MIQLTENAGMRPLISLVIFISTANCADFTTYIGPTNPNQYPYQSFGVGALAVDSEGDTYATGFDLPGSNGAFVTKLDVNGNIAFTKSIAPFESFGNAIALDPTGNVWVGGGKSAVLVLPATRAFPDSSTAIPRPPAADGAVATGASNYCSGCSLTLSDGHAHITETVQYAGAAPGLIDGLMQINFVVPALLKYEPGGGWVYFTPPGDTFPIQLGWVNVSQ
jgi:hypothetical protein